MANITVESTNNADIEAGNRVVVRTSGNRVYVFGTESFTGHLGLAMWKGNADGEPTSFSHVDHIALGLGTYPAIGGACAIDSLDIIHCIYYQTDGGHGGIIALRYVTYDTSNDTFGTPETIAVLDNDANVHTTLGIAIDVNDVPHVIWRDALTDMGTTLNTCWYSNRSEGVTTGVWDKSRVNIASAEDFFVIPNDIIIGEPTSSIGADRPIISVHDPNANTAMAMYHGTALNATAFTEELDVTGSILSSSNTMASMVIDSAGKITVAFTEESSFDLMVVEHLASSAWSSWETPVNVDTSVNYISPSIAVIGTDRYIFVQKALVTASTYYCDANDQTIDNDTWTDDSNAFDGNLTGTFALSNPSGGGYSTSLEGHGTTAPTTGNGVGKVRVKIHWEAVVFTQTSLFRVFTNAQAEQLIDEQEEIVTGSIQTNEYTLSVPTGGWTYLKVNELEFEFADNEISGNLRVYGIEVFVDEVAIKLWKDTGSGFTEETTDEDLPNGGEYDNVKVKWARYHQLNKLYYFDGTVTDNNSTWDDDANIADGSESTAATSTGLGSINYIEIDGTTAPSSGDTIIAVSARFLCEAVTTSGNLRPEFFDDGTQLGSILSVPYTSTKEWVPYGQVTPPVGGWTWAKIQGLEVQTHLSSGAGAKIYKIELIVSVDKDSTDLDYVFTIIDGGTLLYNTIDVGGGESTFDKDFTFDSALKKEDLQKDYTFDSALQKNAITKDFTIDVALRKDEIQKNFTFDVVLKKEVQKDFTFDSTLKKEDIQKDFTFDVCLKKRFDKEFTFDAVLVKQFNKDVTFDAVLVKQFNKDFTFDSGLQKTFDKDFTFDSILVKRAQKDFTFDSTLKKEDVTKDFTFDAVLQVEEIPSTFSFDSVLQKLITKELTFDSRLVKRFQKDFTFDVVLIREAIQKDLTFDAILKKIITKDYTFDVVLSKLITKEFTFDSVLQKLINKDLTFDAQLVKRFQKDFTFDAVLQKVVTKDFTFDAQLEAEANIKNFTFDVVLIKEAIQKDFTFDAGLANKFTKDFTFDSVLVKTVQKEYTFDTVLSKIIQSDFTFDTVLQKVAAKDFTFDSSLVKIAQKDFTFDSALKKEDVIKNFTFDTVLIKEGEPATFTFDSTLKKEGVQKDYTFDSTLQKVVTKDFSFDTVLSKIIQSDFTFDASLINRFQKDYTFDSVLQKTATKDFTFDAQLTTLNVQKDFTFDVVLVKEDIVKDFTFDANLFKERAPKPLIRLPRDPARISDPAYYTTILMVSGDTIDLVRVKVSGSTFFKIKAYVIGDTKIVTPLKIFGQSVLNTKIRTEGITKMIHKISILGNTLINSIIEVKGITQRRKTVKDIARENFKFLFLDE